MACWWKYLICTFTPRSRLPGWFILQSSPGAAFLLDYLLWLQLIKFSVMLLEAEGENMRELEHLHNGPLAVFRISQNLSMRNLGITEHRKHGCNVTFLELGLKYRASVGDFALRISSTPFWCFFKEFRMFLICWNILYNDMVSPKPSLKGYEVLMYCGFVCYVLHF